MSTFKPVPGLDIPDNNDSPSKPTMLFFEIQNEEGVAGSGKPVTVALARKMYWDYADTQADISAALQQLPESEKVLALIESVSGKREVVSGVYGKEAILHILEQEGCEGIRYINCLYKGEKSIFLIGVDKEGIIIGGNDILRTNTRPEPPAKGDAVIYEVKTRSMTRDEIQELLPRL